MRRNGLVLIAMSFLVNVGCAELRHLYQGGKEVYEEVKSTTEGYGVSVKKDSAE